jgi:hypothetical protein
MPSVAAGISRTQDAIEFAQGAHARQQLADGSPFVRHPMEVALLLYYDGAPDHLVAAGVLHDVLEKSDTSVSELWSRFGPQIAELVLAVSDDPWIAGYTERKAALRRKVAGAGDEALALFAADKISKVRELRRGGPHSPLGGESRGADRELQARRIQHYRRSLALLEDRLGESRLVRALRDELDALHAGEPPPLAQTG